MNAVARLMVTIALAAVLPGCAALAPSGSGLTKDLAPKTYVALRYATTVRQQLDFTCGGASLATVLTHYWGRPTTEDEVLKILHSRYPNQAEWKAKVQAGFSLEDLQFAAEALGYKSQAASVAIDDLEQLNGPVIVHLKKTETYLHFTVLRKATANSFYLADPILGAYSMTREQFAGQYTGYLMAVWREDGRLPGGSPLATVRDGHSLSATMGGVIQQMQRPLVTTF
jgi:predicted double-glycine peptidase